MSERTVVEVDGFKFYADVVNGRKVLVQIVEPERTSNADLGHIRGKGCRNRYHVGGSAPSFRSGNRSAWR